MVAIVNVHGTTVSAIGLKGAMVLRIASFIEWPNCGKSEIVVGVYRDNESANVFRNLYRDKTILGHPIVVKEFDQLSQLSSMGTCDILCIGGASRSERPKIIQKFSKNGILLIGNTREDAYIGVAISLLEIENRYKIVINKNALKDQNLRADYRLLQLAELVEGN